jgi:DNA invertase Pin-like site-specific DNA recombinase
VTGLKLGTPVSTAGQDLTAQRDGLHALGVDPDRIYVDHGLTGTNRARPNLREAMAGCRAGDTLVVTKLDRIARSVPDARDIVDELTARGVRLNIGGSVHDPNDPIGRLRFTVLSMIAEFEADLARLEPARAWPWPRLRAGSAASSPSSSAARRSTWCSCGTTAPHTTAELAELFNVGRSTVYRAIKRSGAA